MTPAEVGPQTLVRDVLMSVPGARLAFERHHVDFCCHGSLELAEACARVRADVRAVIATLREEAGKPDAPEPWDDGLASLPLEDVVRHLVENVHALARSELPEIIEYATSIDRSGAESMSTSIIAELAKLDAALEPHLRFEERYVFPYVIALERDPEPPVALFAGIDEPIRDLLREHEHAESSLEALREITGGYRAPAGASEALRALYAMLAAHDEALVRHMHIEGNVLFPRASALERKRRPRNARRR